MERSVQIFTKKNTSVQNYDFIMQPYETIPRIKLWKTTHRSRTFYNRQSIKHKNIKHKSIKHNVKRRYFAVEPVLFLQPDSSCHQGRKTSCFPIIAAILFTYLCAIVIVGTLVARLNVFKSVSNNTSLKTY